MKKKLARWLEDAWYKEMYISSGFMAFSMLYDDVMRARRFLYNKGVYKKTKLAVPVIIVGNITVGGTGKTPLTLWLVRLLKQEGFKPGIISRGYGGDTDLAPQWIDEKSQPDKVGDEAVLMARHADCPIVVGSDRVKAAQLLIDKAECDIVISDDGLQHYALERDIEIAVIDGERRFGNGYTLPCGPLREPIERLQEVDFIIVNGDAVEENEFSMVMKGHVLINLATQEERSLSDFSAMDCYAVAGIGNPQRFFNALEREGIKVESHAFQDHYHFTAEDICFDDDKAVLMTEKDAVKCETFATDRHWYLPIKAEPEQQFTDKLLTLIKEKIRG